MADLVGKPVDNQPAVDERKFLDIDIDNFDERMKALKPRVAFGRQYSDQRRQTERRLNLRQHGRLPAGCRGPQSGAAEQTAGSPYPAFESAHLYGRQNGAEELIAKILQDPTLLKSLSQMPKQDDSAKGSEE